MTATIHHSHTATGTAAFRVQTLTPVVLGIRWFLYTLVLLVIDKVVGLDSSLFLLSIGVALGTFLGSRLAFQHYRPLVVILGCSSIPWLMPRAVDLIGGTLQSIAITLGSSPRSTSLASLSLDFHTQLFSIVAALSVLATYLYWRFRHIAIYEGVIALAAFIAYFSAHRNYHFADAPSVLAETSWTLGVGQLATLVITGGILACLLVGYILISSHPLLQRPLSRSQNPQGVRGRRGIFFQILGTLLGVGLIAGIGRLIFLHHQSQVVSQTANGVSFFENQREAIGKSPLGFHSALGSNNQPAAFVRLEGDYPSNPDENMLYFREGSLSEFNGTELVRADPRFDSDNPLTSPGEFFEREADPELNSRVSLLHSVYLLANHESAFAIDYPIRIARLENPAPNRFDAAYRVYSLAPSYDRASLMLTEAGDPRWTPEIWDHYLVPHPDPRYKELADSLTVGLLTPFEKARAVQDYLSESSIYTLSPGHEVPDGEDPVAPFLFGDHRGYCVHFAHAVVYLLRAIGIPSRISTGYLTDLSFARDGHILLRMSDRHAWAEAYFKGAGWVVFDIQPSQVESHADSDVDMGLLEELMGLVGPEKELLDSDILKSEPELNGDKTSPFLSLRALLTFLGSLLVIFLALKTYLRLSWILPLNSRARLCHRYRSLLSVLFDLGFTRHRGETRLEYASRVAPIVSGDFEALTRAFIAHRYSQTPAIFESTDYKIEDPPPWKRWIAFLHPRSLYELWVTKKW